MKVKAFPVCSFAIRLGRVSMVHIRYQMLKDGEINCRNLPEIGPKEMTSISALWWLEDLNIDTRGFSVNLILKSLPPD